MYPPGLLPRLFSHHLCVPFQVLMALEPPFLAPLMNHGEVGELQGYSQQVCVTLGFWVSRVALPLTSLKLGNSIACAPELPKISLAL